MGLPGLYTEIISLHHPYNPNAAEFKIVKLNMGLANPLKSPLMPSVFTIRLPQSHMPL